jgi:hypothetical protein
MRNLLDRPIAEVIEANIETFKAQCYELYKSPPLGSLVKAGDIPVYGIVIDIATEGLDPSRPIAARGFSATTEQEIYTQNPQLMELLCTKFRAIAVGFSRDNLLIQGYPFEPPRIHAFVHECLSDELSDLSSNPDFIHLLLQHPEVKDEILTASIISISKQTNNREAFLVRAGKTLAIELTGQMSRLNAILRKLKQ